jgi:predicted unusual protein kinase regulating ubiquinone biosynthesis (AarF/ABC1/UbiB family)
MTGQKKIPTGKLNRGRVVGVVAARASGKKLKQVSKQPFLRKEKRKALKEKTDQEIARIIFDALCVLRGTALKAAQLIAMEIDWIPEAYRRELSKASSQVPPMNRALVRKTIKTELGSPEKVFESFESLPFAAASLGQVHRARTRDNRALAVKVQYPGIGEGVASDIKLLKGLLAPTRYGRIFAQCFDEITAKVTEELDYRIEARNTMEFHQEFRWDSLRIPTVASDYSTGTVLATDLITGLHLDQWLATRPSQSLRDQYGQLLVDFLNHCIYEKQVIHADPNPGNFLFGDDGRLGIVDFGCVKRLTPEFVQTISEITTLGQSFDLDHYEKLHNRLGIYYRPTRNRKAFSQFMSRWLAWLQQPYQSPTFDFSANQDYFSQGRRFFKDLYRYIDHYQGSFAYYGRTVQGLMRLLQKLGARVKMARCQG